MNGKLILIAGYCATGKSTFARELSQTLRIPYFSKDTLKEALADGFGSNSGLLQDKGSAAATNMMLHIAECFLRVEKECILESNFRLDQGEQIKSLLEKYNAECLTFLFHGNLDVLWNRYVNRESERHWVHKTVGENKEDFVKGHLEAGIGEIAIGQTVTVDATDFDTIDYETLFIIARRFVWNEANGI
jgi:predicted kinase